MFRRHLRHLQEESCTGINSVKIFWNNQQKFTRPLIWAFWITCGSHIYLSNTILLLVEYRN
jgi:hypothetical protein